MEKRLAAEFREQTLISYEFAKVFPAMAPSLPPAWRGKLGGGGGEMQTKPKSFGRAVAYIQETRSTRCLISWDDR